MKTSITFTLLVGTVLWMSGCNPAHHPQVEGSNQPGQTKLVQPEGPAGTPPIEAPPRPETNSKDKGEGAGIAAGHIPNNPGTPENPVKK